MTAKKSPNILRRQRVKSALPAQIASLNDPENTCFRATQLNRHAIFRNHVRRRANLLSFNISPSAIEREGGRTPPPPTSRSPHVRQEAPNCLTLWREKLEKKRENAHVTCSGERVASGTKWKGCHMLQNPRNKSCVPEVPAP